MLLRAKVVKWFSTASKSSQSDIEKVLFRVNAVLITAVSANDIIRLVDQNHIFFVAIVIVFLRTNFIAICC